MKFSTKKNYQAPELDLMLVEVEEGIATSTEPTNFVDPTTDDTYVNDFWS